MTNELNIDEMLFRCSSLGDIMTEPKLKSETLSETAKKRCVIVWAEHKYGFSKELVSKYTEKGKIVEEESITLLSSVHKTVYTKNEVRFPNKWITGEHDILKDGRVIDIKSSWDYVTFFLHKIDKKINKDYYWQLQGYMDLLNIDKALLAYCLVDTPEEIIVQEENKLWYKLGQPSSDSQFFIDACNELRQGLQYSKRIPKQERVIEFEVERNQEDIDRLHERVEVCREWIKLNLE